MSLPTALATQVGQGGMEETALLTVTDIVRVSQASTRHWRLAGTFSDTKRPCVTIKCVNFEQTEHDDRAFVAGTRSQTGGGARRLLPS